MPKRISNSNVSERRKAERDLRTRNQELNNFVYKVSHDIRAPLSSIKGLINLSKLERLNYNYLPKIEDRVDHLDGFIRDILSHSRNLNTAVVIEQIDLRSLVEDWMGQLDYMNVSKEIKKDIDIDGEEFFSSFRLSAAQIQPLPRAHGKGYRGQSFEPDLIDGE